MYFQLVDNQVLSTQGQPDVFNLHRLTAAAPTKAFSIGITTGWRTNYVKCLTRRRRVKFNTQETRGPKVLSVDLMTWREHNPAGVPPTSDSVSPAPAVSLRRSATSPAAGITDNTSARTPL